MRKFIKRTLMVSILLGGFIPPVLFADDEGTLVKAKALYEQKHYWGSVVILESLKNRNAEAIYWLWKAEREIGSLSDLPARDPASPNHKYYKYVKDHEDYFRYYEPDGSYIPSGKRYEEINRLFPHTEYTGSMLFEMTEDSMAREVDEEEGELTEESRVHLISRYQDFLNRYPHHLYVKMAKQKIGHLEKLTDLPTYFFQFYSKNFIIDRKLYDNYITEWLRSGPYREFGIEVMPSEKIMHERLSHLDIPDEAKNTIQELIEKDGKLIMISEAAFKRNDWDGPKFIVFDPNVKLSR